MRGAFQSRSELRTRTAERGRESLLNLGRRHRIQYDSILRRGIVNYYSFTAGGRVAKLINIVFNELNVLFSIAVLKRCGLGCLPLRMLIIEPSPVRAALRRRSLRTKMLAPATRASRPYGGKPPKRRVYFSDGGSARQGYFYYLRFNS